MYINPEEYLKEGLEIVHETIMLATKGADSHKDFRAGPTWYTRYVIIADFNSQIEIDKETVVFILRKNNITDRYIAVENASLKEQLIPK